MVVMYTDMYISATHPARRDAALAIDEWVRGVVAGRYPRASLRQ